MVLASLGVNRSDEELRIATDCGYAGARGLAIVDAARSEGFTQTKKANLNIEELRGEVERGLFPIAYVATNPSSWLTEPHAVVVIEVNDNYVKTVQINLLYFQWLGKTPVFGVSGALARTHRISCWF